MANLKGKTVLITGGSRGIGLAMALRAARDGANVAIIAKTTKPHPKLPGTIYTAAEQIEKAGGQALPLACDIRFEDQVTQAIEKTVSTFGGIDICVNNASVVSLTKVLESEMKRFDLMHQVVARGTFLVSKTCLPHLLKAKNPHILNLCPPIDLMPEQWPGKLSYLMAKMGASLCVLGMSEEFKHEGVAVNGLWPRGFVATAAVKNLLGGIEQMKQCMKPEMVADAAHIIVNKPSKEFTGNFLIDAEVLKNAGASDLDQYKINPETDLDADGNYIQRV